MNILALNPPFHNKFSREMRSPAVTKSGTLYYPMWLAYATGLLEQNGHKVKLVDAPAKESDINTIIENIKGFNPSLIILNTSTPSIYNDAHIAEDLKNYFPKSFIIMVGTHVSALPEDSVKLNIFIDAVAIGEYDQTVVDIANALENGNDISVVNGIAYKDGENIIKTGKREYITDLDSFPFVSEVYKKNLDYTDYFYSHSKHPIITIVTGRGCPFKCTYCVYPQTMHGGKYRYRSVENVADEFEYIYKNFPAVQEIMIEDDTLTVNKKRCQDLAKLLIKRGLNKIPWSANSRADVDLQTMQIMKKAGCRLFCVGFESGDQDILNNIKKGTTLPRIRMFAMDAKKAGIMIHGCFMVGNRGETKETLRKTLDLALELNPDTAQFFPIMVYPGTDDYEWVKKKGFLISEDYSKWVTEKGLHNSVVSNPDLNYKELVNFCNYARKKFYLRCKYVRMKIFQSILHPSEAVRNFKAFKTFAKHLFLKPETSN